MTVERYRMLFCLPTTALSGGVKVIFEIANRMVDAGHSAELFSYAGAPKWTSPKAPLISAKDIRDIDSDRYDFIFVSNAFFLPLVLPHARSARVIFFCQDWESFHHAGGTAYADFMAESPTFVALYRLPVPIIAISRAVRDLIVEHTGRDAYYMPVGLNKTVFTRQPPKLPTPRKRVLFVGNYLMPYKGMRDGLAALRMLSTEMPLELVLVTQEYRDRHVLDECDCPVELHFCPTETEMPAIYGSADVYCCTSWYEGLGLPALEAFRCGTPVVSTRTYGVSDYGVDNQNLLLAAPNNPADLADKLRRILTDDALAEQLRSTAFATVESDYDWDISFAAFSEALAKIDRSYAGAGPIDPPALRALSEQLEDEGNFTPIETFRVFYEFTARASALYRRMAVERHASPEVVEALGRVRDDVRPYVANPRAEYYRAFKAEYDRCQLVLNLVGDSRFPQYLDALLAHGQSKSHANAAAHPQPGRSHA